MYKQIYNKLNGEPKLIQDNYDEKSGVSIFEYDKEKYTDSMPPNNLYQPIHFDEDSNKWIGVVYEEWKGNQNDTEPYKPSKLEKDLAKSQMQLFTTQLELKEARQENAKTTKEIFKLKVGLE